MALLDAFLLEPYPLSVFVAQRTDGAKGSGTPSDPYDGSTAVDFDEVMSKFLTSSNVTIHLGPGTFKTTGWNVNTGSGGWQARPGMKILGSGIDVTILKLEGVGSSAHHYYAIGHALGASSSVDHFEVRDMTIDCGVPTSGSAACGAIQALGSHVKITRVKAINWGTRSSGSSNPCFVFALITAYPDGVLETRNSGIEECVAVNPFESTGLVTVFHVGRQEAASGTNEGLGRSPYIRNCLVDCQKLSPLTAFVPNPNPATAKYRALSMGWCRGGLVEGNDVRNTDIGGPYSHQDNRSVRDLVVRKNLYWNVGRGPFFKLGGLGGELVPLPTTGSLSRSGSVATITGTSVTGLAVGDRVKLVSSSPSTFTGVYVITSIQGSQLTVTTPVTTDSSATVTSLKKVFGISRVVIESNIIELANSVNGNAIAVEDGDASYVEAPDYVHGDVFIRNNKIRYVDGAAPAVPAGASDLAFEVEGAKHLAASNNVIESANPKPMTDLRSGAVRYFNNKTPAGVLVQGWNVDTSRRYDELETESDLALVLSLFNKR